VRMCVRLCVQHLLRVALLRGTPAPGCKGSCADGKGIACMHPCGSVQRAHAPMWVNPMHASIHPSMWVNPMHGTQCTSMHRQAQGRGMTPVPVIPMPLPVQHLLVQHLPVQHLPIHAHARLAPMNICADGTTAAAAAAVAPALTHGVGILRSSFTGLNPPSPRPAGRSWPSDKA
jgi:hypothetical protein